MTEENQEEFDSSQIHEKQEYHQENFTTHQFNQETQYCTIPYTSFIAINCTVISITNVVTLLADDFSEFQIPAHFLPPKIQQGQVYQLSLQHNKTEEYRRKSNIEKIQKSIQDLK